MLLPHADTTLSLVVTSFLHDSWSLAIPQQLPMMIRVPAHWRRLLLLRLFTSPDNRLLFLAWDMHVLAPPPGFVCGRILLFRSSPGLGTFLFRFPAVSIATSAPKPLVPSAFLISLPLHPLSFFLLFPSCPIGREAHLHSCPIHREAHLHSFC